MRDGEAAKELLGRAQDAVAMARKAGAADAWAEADRSREVSIQVRDGKIEQVKEATSRSLSLRLWVDGRYSTHATTDLRDESLLAFVAEAVKMTRALQPDPFRVLPDPALYEGRYQGDLELLDPAMLALDRDQRIAWCQEMNARVVGKPNVISATSSSGDGSAIGAGASTNGFSGVWESSSVGLYTEVNLQDAGDKRPAAWFGMGTRKLTDLMGAEAIADEALRRGRARLGSKKGPTARTRMVVDRHAAGMLLGRLIGPASGRAVQQKQSFWADRLGQELVSPKLSVVDDPLIPRGLASRPFDGEGIAAKRMSVIEGGALRTFYIDTYYGKKLGLPPTTGAPSNRVVAPGSVDLDGLIRAAGSGVYVTDWLGGNMDSTTGDFSFGAQGQLIDGGKLAGPIGEMNVTGNILQLFRDLVDLGSDVWPHSGLRTGSLLFDGVSFSGA
ncbi:MAG TPA: TldD/PmbA family protein [Kofleriaceae bacterium]|nr:TldD/PmbA family protein [Kofleriaceae bacterium]